MPEAMAFGTVRTYASEHETYRLPLALLLGASGCATKGKFMTEAGAQRRAFMLPKAAPGRA